MYELGITRRFSAAHRLVSYEGRCEALHGHNYRVEVVVQGDTLVNGLLIDFKLLKQKVDEVIKSLDHVYLNDLEPFKKSEPSAENIAAYIYTGVVRQLGDAVRIRQVKVWEADDTWALYRTEE